MTTELQARLAERVSNLEPTFNEQFGKLADERGNQLAVVDEEMELTFADLEATSNRVGRMFGHRGVQPGGLVLISTRSCTDIIVATIGAWKIGAIPMPVSDRMTAHELAQLIELAAPALIVDSENRTDSDSIADLASAQEFSDVALAPTVAPSLKAPTSGGTTGRPKVIVATAEATPQGIVELGTILGVHEGGVALVTAALSHNASFSTALASIVLGTTTVFMRRFDAEETLRKIEQHRATWVYAVPTMMQRILRLPESMRKSFDLSSLTTLLHLAAPCPRWVKQEFIDWLGPETIYEIYGPTEAQAVTTVTGHEWLKKPGTVGRPVLGEISVRDSQGVEVPAGEIGEVWLRRGAEDALPYRYIGGTAESAEDNWETVGDIGYVDEDGYLFLSDRRTDMMLVGGVNVYPAEIENVASEHPQVLSAVCVGLQDPERGTVPALAVETVTGEVPADLEDFLEQRLSKVKRPRSVTATERALRDRAGKVRRRSIADEYFSHE